MLLLEFLKFYKAGDKMAANDEALNLVLNFERDSFSMPCI